MAAKAIADKAMPSTEAPNMVTAVELDEPRWVSPLELAMGRWST